MFDGLGTALEILLAWDMVGLLLVGAGLGLVVAILPGISGVNTMALLLPLTFGLDQYQAMALLVAIMAAGGFGGSITSILVNVPGDGTNAATTLDGYPMSRNGRAGEAIGASATASALGALVGVVVLVISLPLIRSIILAFGPPELFAAALAGIALIASVSRGSMLKGLTAALIGMTIGFIGMNLTLGGTRYTFGSNTLFEGIPLIPAVIGLFAIPEIYQLLRSNQSISRTGSIVKGGVSKGVKAVLQRPFLLIRSSLIGVGVGLVPGVGGSVAPWVSYFTAQKSTRSEVPFGEGAIEGVIAPEASNDSKDGGALMPLLALGVPGSLTTAILLSAFLIHGVQPGQRLFQTNMQLIWVMIIAIVFANFATSALGMAAANALVRLTVIPASIMAPIVLSLALIGGFADMQRLIGVTLTFGIGLVGILLVKAGYPRPPLLVGFILLPIVERNFHQSLAINRGSFEFLLRPITLSILVVSAAAMFGPRLFEAMRKRASADSDQPDPAASPTEGAAESTATLTTAASTTTTELRPAEPAEWVIAVATTVLIIVFAWEAREFSEAARLFPMIVLVPLGVLMLVTVVGLLRRSAAAGIARLTAEQRARLLPDRWVLGWMVALPVAIWALGMVWGVGLYLVLARAFYEPSSFSRRRLIEGALSAGIVLLVLHVLFVRTLGLRLPAGLFA